VERELQKSEIASCHHFPNLLVVFADVFVQRLWRMNSSRRFALAASEGLVSRSFTSPFCKGVSFLKVVVSRRHQLRQVASQSKKEIVTDTGKPIAGTRDKATAEDIADRLNSDHAQEEQDRWA
jgi:hypothetical protein